MSGSGTAEGRSPRAVQVVLLVPALAAVAALGWAVAHRVGAEFPLEWQEPCMLDHALRWLHGQSIYAEPSMDFAAFPYPPLFHCLGGLSIEALGPGLPALRWVSVLALGLLLLAIQRIGRGAEGIAGAGLMAAAYGWTGFWYDTARVDTLAHALIALSMLLALRLEEEGADGQSSAASSAAASARRASSAGLLATLSVLAKQTCLVPGLLIGAALFIRRRTRRSGAWYLGAFALTLGVTVAWLESTTEGWFLWTTVDLLKGSPFHGPAVLGFWIESAWVAVPLVLLTVLGLGQRRSAGWSPVLASGFLALVLTGWAGRAHEGGFANTLMPVALAAAILSARLLPVLPRARQIWGAAAVGATSMFLLQDPRVALPEDGSADAHRAAEAMLQPFHDAGDVWQPLSAIPAVVPGKLHKMALVDLAKSRETDVAGSLLRSLRSDLAAQRFAAIVLAELPRTGWADLAADLERSYEITATLSLPEPATGAPLTPRFIATPR